MQDKLRPRAMMEEFESKYCTPAERNLDRKAKWARLFVNNARGLRSELVKAIPELMADCSSGDRAKNEKSMGNKVGDIAQGTYRTLSNYVHSFDNTREVPINEAVLSENEVKFLKVICEILPVIYKIIRVTP